MHHADWEEILRWPTCWVLMQRPDSPTLGEPFGCRSSEKERLAMSHSYLSFLEGRAFARPHRLGFSCASYENKGEG